MKKDKHMHIRCTQKDKEFNKAHGGDAKTYDILRRFWEITKEIDDTEIETIRKGLLTFLGDLE